MNPTAIDTMRKELMNIQRLMAVCVSEEGIVINELKYDYQNYVRQARNFYEAIEYMERKIYAKT